MILGEMDEFTGVHANLQKQRKYVSRQSKRFDQYESDDNSSDTPELSWRMIYDTKNNEEGLHKPNARLRQYRQHFEELLQVTPYATMHPIISLIITYDSQRIVAVTKASETAYFVKMYDLNTFELTF